MARTPTQIIPLGYKAPEFKLPNTNGQSLSFQDIKGEKGTVVMFICNHCPFVVHVIDQIVNIAKEYQELGIGFVAINSNDVVNYPADSPEKMKEFHKQYEMSFPYLFDESQEVAKAYSAACTPDFSVYNSTDLCVYRGQLDGSRPGNEVLSDGKDLRKVLDYILEDKKIDFDQTPSLGCNIKWK